MPDPKVSDVITREEYDTITTAALRLSRQAEFRQLTMLLTARKAGKKDTVVLLEGIVNVMAETLSRDAGL